MQVYNCVGVHQQWSGVDDTYTIGGVDARLAGTLIAQPLMLGSPSWRWRGLWQLRMPPAAPTDTDCTREWFFSPLPPPPSPYPPHPNSPPRAQVHHDPEAYGVDEFLVPCAAAMVVVLDPLLEGRLVPSCGPWRISVSIVRCFRVQRA